MRELNPKELELLEDLKKMSQEEIDTWCNTARPFDPVVNVAVVLRKLETV